jgi:ribosomal protein S18 acetylase RimI-like enzyme
MRQAGFFPADQWVGMSYGGIGSRIAGFNDSNVIDGRNDIVAWTNVVSETLFHQNPLDEGIFQGLCSRGVELIGVKAGDELAGTSMVYIDEDGIAGIYMVGIKEKFRGRGLGKQLVVACMKSIAEKGIDKCYLQSTRMGLGLYKGLNFKETDKYLIFCKIK